MRIYVANPNAMRTQRITVMRNAVIHLWNSHVNKMKAQMLTKRKRAELVALRNEITENVLIPNHLNRVLSNQMIPHQSTIIKK